MACVDSRWPAARDVRRHVVREVVLREKVCTWDLAIEVVVGLDLGVQALDISTCEGGSHHRVEPLDERKPSTPSDVVGMLAEER